MDLFADIMKQTVRELEKSIFTDERMEKRIAGALRKCGMRVLYTYLFLNGEGKFEVHVTVEVQAKRKGRQKKSFRPYQKQREDVLSLHMEVRR